MAHPSQPTATGTGRDLWWGVARENGAQNFCATNGAVFLSDVRRALGLSAALVWDDALHLALISIAESYVRGDASWAPVAAGLRADLAIRLIRPEAMAIAAWVAYYRPHGLRLDRVVFLANTVPPPWGEAPRAGNMTLGLLCWDPARHAQPEADESAAVAASRYGVRLEAGEAPPAPPSDFADGLPGASGMALALTGLGFVGLLILVASQRKAR